MRERLYDISRYTRRSSFYRHLPASPPYILSGNPSLSVELAFDFDPLNATAETSFRFESLVNMISSGTPGLTNDAFMYSVPRSMPMTAEEAAEAVAVRRNSRERMKGRLDSRRLP